MSKSITVPDLGNYPVSLWLDGKKYGPYKVGETVSVPEEVADFLEELAEERNKSVPPDPDAAPATIGDVKALIWGEGERYETLVETTMGTMEYVEIHGTGFWFGESAEIDLDDGLALAEEMEADDVVLYFNSAANALTKIDPEMIACNMELDSEGYPAITGSPAVGLGIAELEAGVGIALYADKDLSGQTVRILRKVEEKSDDAVATVGDVKRLIGDSGAGKWIVNFTTDTEAEQTIQCDKTPAEILAAQNAGKIVVGRFQIGAYMVEAPLVEYGSALLTFGALAGKISYAATWKGNDWEVRMVELATA